MKSERIFLDALHRQTAKHPERLGIAVEALTGRLPNDTVRQFLPLHQEGIEFSLGVVAKRGMTKIMREACRLNHVCV